MAIADDIITARNAGAVRCGLNEQPVSTVVDLAREYGLRDDADCFVEIDEAASRRIIQLILHKDLAYGAEIMSPQLATELTNMFLAQFDAGTRYFTNGNWHLPASNGSWSPVTEATFDAGVLAMSPGRSGCVWVEDED